MSSPVALRRFFGLLEAQPFISGVKLLNDGEVSEYPLAPVGSVKKSAFRIRASLAIGHVFIHNIRILQHNIRRYPNFASIFGNVGLQINAFCKRTVETLSNTDAVSQ